MRKRLPGKTFSVLTPLCPRNASRAANTTPKNFGRSLSRTRFAFKRLSRVFPLHPAPQFYSQFNSHPNSLLLIAFLRFPHLPLSLRASFIAGLLSRNSRDGKIQRSHLCKVILFSSFERDPPITFCIRFAIHPAVYVCTAVLFKCAHVLHSAVKSSSTARKVRRWLLILQGCIKRR